MAFRAPYRHLVRLRETLTVSTAKICLTTGPEAQLHLRAICTFPARPGVAATTAPPQSRLTPLRSTAPHKVLVGAVLSRRLKHGGKKGKGGGKGRKGHSPEGDEEAESLDDIAGLSDTKGRFDKVLEGLKHDLQGLRGGKTDPAILDNIKVESYGSMSTLSSVAQASMKGPQLIVLSVYDPAMTNAVEDAVRECGMGLNPSSEGQGQVLVPIPKPTKESREAVAKMAAKHAEKSKVVLRGIRHKIQDHIKKNKDSFPEDEVHQRMKEIDKCTQEAEANANKMLEKKKAEILTV
ncbi:unnamed protein product [Ascophyllum nodosum]